MNERRLYTPILLLLDFVIFLFYIFEFTFFASILKMPTTTMKINLLLIGFELSIGDTKTKPLNDEFNFSYTYFDNL